MTGPYDAGAAAGPAVPPDQLPSGSPVESIEAALGVIPPRPSIPLPRWLGPLALCCLIGMLPWIVYLSMTIPRRSRAEHYDLAWIGFDCAMWVVLAALAFFALRRHPATGPVAAVASTMLLIDAWFDITTSANRDQLVVAVVLACTAEIPLAIICGWAAINAERIRARAYRRLHTRWENALMMVRAMGPGRGEQPAVSVSPPPAARPPR